MCVEEETPVLQVVRGPGLSVDPPVFVYLFIYFILLKLIGVLGYRLTHLFLFIYLIYFIEIDRGPGLSVDLPVFCCVICFLLVIRGPAPSVELTVWSLV